MVWKVRKAELRGARGVQDILVTELHQVRRMWLSGGRAVHGPDRAMLAGWFSMWER